MKTSLKWIKALVPGLDCSAQEYMDAMTLSGSKCEGYEQMELQVVADNVKAVNLYKSLGFVICGTLPDSEKYSDGSYSDMHMMCRKLL